MSGYDLFAEATIPGVPLETILCTEKLRSRPCRAPDYEKENRALVALASALVNSQSSILQTLAETILEVTQSDSSGLSLLTKDDGGKRFYWAAIAGMWKRHIGGGTPRDFGPCGDVLDRNSTLLFQRFERRYRYFLPITPLAEECLLIPFYVGGKAVGTIWAIMHGGRRHFDAEDERLMSTLGRFASLAYQTVASIEDLKMQIAAREKAEAAVRQLNSGLQAKIRRLVNSNIIGVFIWDLDGSITEANEAFLRLVGYDRCDLLSGRMSWKELTPPEWREADDRRVAELRATGAVQPYEKEYFLKCGSRVRVLIGAALFKEGGDEGLAFVLDLTELKRVEEALSQARLDFAHMNRVSMMGELAASLSHEILHPIATARNNARAGMRFLEMNPPSLDETREALACVVRDADRAKDIVGRMRDHIKKAPPRKERFDLNSATNEVIVLAQSVIHRNDVSVQTRLADGLLPVLGDRIQLQQVLLNLILNAAEAMGSVEEGARELLISTEQDQAGALVAVRDSGPGIDAQHLDRVFDTFYTTKSSGTGMGLSICRSIIHAHGGKLWAEANEPRGAVFQFTLPADNDS